VGLRGQRQILFGLFHQHQRFELWNSLACTLPTFEEIGLVGESSDLVVWQKCQSNQLVLMTANRNEKGKESLEWVIRAFNRPDSLPVITLSSVRRFMLDVGYRHRVADKVLEDIFEIDRYRGAGRLWVP